MAQGTLWISPIQRALANTTAAPVTGALAYFFLAGTTTAVSVYSNVTLTTPLSQPVVADGNGIFPEIFLTPGTAYKVDLQTAAGVSLTGYPADNQLAIPSSSSNVAFTGTAGESISAGQGVYLSDGSGGKNAGQWYKADNTNAYSSTLNDVGIAPAAIASGSTGSIQTAGQVTGQVGLTIGAVYYVGVAGALTVTPPSTNARAIGQADSSTSIVIPNSAYASILLTAKFVGAVVSDLLFTDASFDIGKSGATRPRDGFFSRNVAIGGTLGVTGHVTVEGVTSTGATGTGKLVFDTAAVHNGTFTINQATGSFAMGSTTGLLQFTSSNTSATGKTWYFQETAADPNGIDVEYTGAAPNDVAHDFVRLHDTGGVRAEIRSNGGFANFQANDVNLSDADVKFIAGPVQSQRALFRGLALVQARYKDAPHTPLDVMVTAQNVQSIYPTLIADFDGHLGVREHGLMMRAFKVIQELDADLMDLHTRLGL